MDLTSIKTIKYLLKKYQTYPLKRLGQNFLVNKEVLRKFVKGACLCPQDKVLEIGPGIGVLTCELAKIANKIIAVEKGPKIIEVLKETLKEHKNVEIIQGDILKTQISWMWSRLPGGLQLKTKNYKIVANLPYYIAAPVIRKFLESKNPPEIMVLMVQKEIAQRICAKPPRMNLLAVSVQFYAKPEIISYISKKSFWPSPKVDGAIIKIRPLINAERGLINTELFFRIVRAGFSHPRKQILNNFSEVLKLSKDETRFWLLKNKIYPIQRAETLTIKNWIYLTKSLKV